MRYPCSYMIYSAQFEQLPALAKIAVYHRMWDVCPVATAIRSTHG
jgi:hypothetical protein